MTFCFRKWTGKGFGKVVKNVGKAGFASAVIGGAGYLYGKDKSKSMSQSHHEKVKPNVQVGNEAGSNDDDNQTPGKSSTIKTTIIVVIGAFIVMIIGVVVLYRDNLGLGCDEGADSSEDNGDPGQRGAGK